MHPSPILSAGEIEPLIKFSKRAGGLTGFQFLEGVAGGDFFQGEVAVFT